MGSNSRKTVSWLVLATDSKGNDRRLVAGEIVLAVALENAIPVLLFLDLLEASLAQTDDSLFRGMERRLGLVHKVQKVLGFNRGWSDLSL